MTLLEEAARDAVNDYMSDKGNLQRKIKAVKHVRAITGLGLREAVRAIESEIKRRATTPPTPKG